MIPWINTQFNWNLSPNEYTNDGYSRIHTWSSRVDKVTIQLVQDIEFNFHYVELISKIEELDPVALDSIFESTYCISDPVELLHRATSLSNGAEFMQAIIANRDEIDSEVVRLVESGLESRQLDVKKAAILSLPILASPELFPAIKRAIAVEENEQIRATLQFIEKGILSS